MELPSTKPYLLRAIWEWCCDNGFTPYIAVQVDARTQVPREFVRDGQIVLNLGPDATNKLQMGNELIEFQARFGGVARELSVPVGQISAIYARENGAGMAFETGDETLPFDENEEAVPMDEVPDDEPPSPSHPEGGRPKLQRVK
ncbi:ClpXP protease specificity-enhancing factor [Azonexus hydrophilus]|uniref:ClpXP protease specificity-enhancing factor n=1 Tax=Azonexus hydrophilus TaxID=418702 RepID=A0ABZ2XLH9_9RHOO|nr:ClpXP protease specificity-enhancing factor [Azonexus hydrophilus]